MTMQLHCGVIESRTCSYGKRQKTLTKRKKYYAQVTWSADYNLYVYIADEQILTDTALQRRQYRDIKIESANWIGAF